VKQLTVVEVFGHLSVCTLVHVVIGPLVTPSPLEAVSSYHCLVLSHSSGLPYQKTIPAERTCNKFVTSVKKNTGNTKLNDNHDSTEVTRITGTVNNN